MLSSCQIRKVSVDLYVPGKIEYPPELRTLLVTSRYVPATGVYEDVQWGGYESVDSVKWKLSEALVDSLGKELVRGNHFLVKVRHNPRMLKNNTAGFPEPQPWEGMTELIKKEFVQGVLLIEGFDYGTGPVSILPVSGGFLARRTDSVTMAVRVYEPLKRRLVEDSVFCFNKIFEGAGTSREAALQALPGGPLGAYWVIGAAAAGYVGQVLPGSYPEKRTFYQRGDSLLLVADTAIKKGNWNRAEAKWTYLAYRSKDSSLQALGSYNMVLACERDGRLNQALGFARRSERLKPDRKTREYIALLEKKMNAYQEKIKKGDIIRNW
ncbi:MAG: hypothetical protein A2X22_06825 [Bacteroidetes bacterium GWF2_49_14]|nr:MAG: hypothetical protein A2X22_06825 [Bacteroidetes bacterium GWF2_49_14]HBB91580.1 hypothetical protein [Bacteroidales bacterium]